MTEHSSNDAQKEEIEVLRSMYDESQLEIYDRYGCTYVCYTPQDYSAHLKAILSPDYPTVPPTVELTRVTRDQAKEIEHDLTKLYNDSAGEVVLFSYIQHLDEWCMNNQSMQESTKNTLQNTNDSSDSYSDSDTGSSIKIHEQIILPDIVHGEPMTERKSVFQAHVAHVTSVAQVQAVMDELLKDNKIAKATHNISAYRIYDEEKHCWIKDNDEDGEDAAGKRLSMLLEMMEAQNVIVIVSRWYGGVKLGPSRFRCINNTARELLESCGFSNRATSTKSK